MSLSLEKKLEYSFELNKKNLCEFLNDIQSHLDNNYPYDEMMFDCYISTNTYTHSKHEDNFQGDFQHILKDISSVDIIEYVSFGYIITPKKTQNFTLTIRISADNSPESKMLSNIASTSNTPKKQNTLTVICSSDNKQTIDDTLDFFTKYLSPKKSTPINVNATINKSDDERNREDEKAKEQDVLTKKLHKQTIMWSCIAAVTSSIISSLITFVLTKFL